MDFDNSGSPGSFFTSVVRELKSLAISNIEYFKDGKHSHHAKFHVAFCLLFEYLDLGIEPCFREICLRVHEFDASPAEKGNGYRSLLRIVQKCCLHLLQIARHVSTSRESALFRRAFYMKELEAYVATLGQLRACLYYAQKLMTYCQAGQLFADEETLDDVLAEQLMTDVEMLSQDCFYGRCLGFQFCESMQRPLNVVAIAMASFAEGYQENSQIMKVASSLFNSGKYIINPDLRAQQIVNVTRTADIQFCKAFWSITETEIMHQLPSMVCPAVQVDEVFHLGPDAFDMPSADGQESITITPPCAHTGPAPVQVRLISHQLREGQEQHVKGHRTTAGSRSPPVTAPRSKALLVHCHGGGFVAQSSRSHEVYLRHWAKGLNVPILSIDYSLAPESPFPRALEECFYVYAWAVHNCHKLGSTGETIVLAGDSAGGNLILATAMRATSFCIRPPDGILGVYTPVLVRYTPSPARLLSLMDPLLPAGILSRCLAAYAGVSDEVSSQLAASVSCHIESSAATLRLSSQEHHDSDWVLVSQDTAARTNTTLAASRKPPPLNTRKEEEDEEDEGEVELFRRPRPVVGTMGQFMSGATEKLVSYVGSCTHMLAKNFSSNPKSPEQIPLTSVPDAQGGGSGVDRHSSSAETSPCSPSFHTPLTTPSGERGSDLSQTPSTSPGPEENRERSSDTARALGTNPKAEKNKTSVGQSLSTTGELRAEDSDSQMVEVDLDEEEPASTEEDGGQLSAEPASANFTEHGVMNSQGTTEGEEMSLHDYSLVQPSLPPQSRSDEDDQFALCDRHQVVAMVSPAGASENQSGDQGVVTQSHTDESAISSASSTTLPSSLISTPTDPLESFDMLPSHSPPIDSESSSSLSFLSPETDPSPAGLLSQAQAEGSHLEQARGDRDHATHTGPEGAVCIEPSSHVGLESVNSAAFNASSTDASAEQCSRVKSASVTATDTAACIEPSSHTGVNPLHSAAADTVEPVSHSCIESVNHAANTTAASCVDGAGSHGNKPLMSPDSGCLSDETEKDASSNTAGVENLSTHSSPSRQHLHLKLHKTTSSSSHSIPRSMSLPALGHSLTSRPHSMSPSDFKRERHLAQSPLKAIRNIPIVKNPYMSPLLAPDWLLEGLPHVCLVACHLDPLLDDSVMFTRRLRSMGKSVELTLLDDLPHGFLNFSLASRDARQASNLCMNKLRQLLKLDEEQAQL